MTDQLVEGLRERNRQSWLLQSPALETATRIRFIDILLRGMDPKTRSDPSLANLGMVRSISVPAASGDWAIVFYGVGVQMLNTPYGDVHVALVKHGVQSWDQRLDGRTLARVENIDAIPHQAEFTPDDLGVIEAVMDRRFPDRNQTLLVVNETLGAPPLFIPALSVGRRVTFVPRERFNVPGLIQLSRPTYSADGQIATLPYVVAFSQGTGTKTGSSTATLQRTDGGWTVTSDKYQRLASTVIDPNVPFRVGGDVKAPIPTNRFQPKFPEGVRGLIFAEIVVDREGHVKDAKILKPLSPDGDRIALEAVRQWQFQPGTLNGKPVAVIYNVTFSVP